MVMLMTVLSLSATAEKIPVILDTDLGSDIDDTWALALILTSPELDLKLVVTDSMNTVGRAKLTAKFLETVGRSDVPVGIGEKRSDDVGNQMPWAKDYDLESYPGTIHEDGIGAMIDCIMKSDREIALIVIGPAPNIEIALRREPRIAKKARVIAMSGSVHLGYGGKKEIDAEYNVAKYPPGTAAMYAAEWDVTITPLDTAGLVHLRGEKYQRLLECKTALATTLLDNYRVWAGEDGKEATKTRSSTLFDPVAVYLTHDTSWCVMKDVKLRVTEDGKTVIDEKDGNLVHAALEWRDMDAFEDYLVERYTRE